MDVWFVVCLLSVVDSVCVLISCAFCLCVVCRMLCNLCVVECVLFVVCCLLFVIL